MKSAIVSVIVFMAMISPAIMADVGFPDLRYLEAYPAYNYEGPHTKFLDYVPDLGAYSLDNAIKSICYTGFWILYNGTNYEGYLGTFSGVNRCYNLSSSSINEVSSLRYAGSAYGLNDISYKVYETIGYGGIEFTGNINAASFEELDLNTSVSSLFITGQSPWTFFTGVEYTGLAVCLYPAYHQTGENGIDIDYIHVYSMDLIQLPDDSIRSVARGCLTENIIRMPHSEPPPRHEDDHKLIEQIHWEEF